MTSRTKGVGIELRGVVVRFGSGKSEHAALDGLDLTVPPGRVTTLLGPSGAGKSTLLRAVAGLLVPDDGDILFGGASVLGLPPEKRGLGMVFQSYALFPHLSVEDNVAFASRVRGLGKRPARRGVAAVLARLEIGHLARRFPHQLSGGERQRVALARALAAEPRALLLDEPLAALDARLRLALRGELALRLREAGLTALYVTHDQEEAMALGDRVAVLRDGRLEQVGTPMEIYRAPASSFVARFIGEANFLPVTWRPEARELSGPLGAWPVDAETATRFGGPARGSLMVRPAAFRTVETGPGSDAVALRGRVLTTAFLGDRRRLTVQVAQEVEALKVDVSAPPQEPDGPMPGDLLPLAFDLADAVLLADPGRQE